MVDIVERLRRTAAFIAQATGKENSRWVEEAAAEIERLRPYVDAFRREEARADKLGTEVDDLRAQVEGARATPARSGEL